MTYDFKLLEVANEIRDLRMNILCGPVGEDLQPLAKSEFHSAMVFLELAVQAFKRASLAHG